MVERYRAIYERTLAAPQIEKQKTKI